MTRVDLVARWNAFARDTHPCNFFLVGRAPILTPPTPLIVACIAFVCRVGVFGSVNPESPEARSTDVAFCLKAPAHAPIYGHTGWIGACFTNPRLFALGYAVPAVSSDVIISVGSYRPQWTPACRGMGQMCSFSCSRLRSSAKFMGA